MISYLYPDWRSLLWDCEVNTRSPHARRKNRDPRSGTAEGAERNHLRSDSAALSIFSKGRTKALPIKENNFDDNALVHHSINIVVLFMPTDCSDLHG